MSRWRRNAGNIYAASSHTRVGSRAISEIRLASAHPPYVDGNAIGSSRVQGPTDDPPHSRRRALKAIRLAFYAAFGFGISLNLIILSCLIDWQGVAESVLSLFNLS